MKSGEHQSFKREDVRVEARNREYDGYFKVDAYDLNHPLYLGGRSESLRRLVFERGRVGAVLPYDPRRDEVVLIEQFRPGPWAAGEHCWLLESVAGVLEDGESPQELCLREAMEEAGCAITRLVLMHRFFTSPGASTELVDLFCGETDTSEVGGVHGLASEGEDILVKTMPREEAEALLASGGIVNAKTIISLQWLMLNHQRVRDEWLG